MNIIILGAGQVGGSLTELLTDENDVTVVDSSETALRQLQDRLDIRTIKGDASKPTTLAEAGAERADMLIAVQTATKQICSLAQSLSRFTAHPQKYVEYARSITSKKKGDYFNRGPYP